MNLPPVVGRLISVVGSWAVALVAIVASLREIIVFPENVPILTTEV